jgi:hypothetical protein
LISIKGHHTVRCWLYQDAEGHQAPFRQQQFQL